MTILRVLLFVITTLMALPPVAIYAQSGSNLKLAPAQYRQSTQDDAAGAAACAGCGGFIFVIFTLFALNIALLIWVARDAKSRGMDGSILWMLLVMFTSVIGFVIYMLSRPQGELTQCPTCRGKRLRVSAICPHCHHP